MCSWSLSSDVLGSIFQVCNQSNYQMCKQNIALANHELPFSPLCTHTVKCLHTERLPQLKLTRKGKKHEFSQQMTICAKNCEFFTEAVTNGYRNTIWLFFLLPLVETKLMQKDWAANQKKWINKSLNSWKSDWSKCYQVAWCWENGIEVMVSEIGGNLHTAMNDKKDRK